MHSSTQGPSLNSEHHDMDAPNLGLDTAVEPSQGLHLPKPDRSDRLFENNPLLSHGPSITRRLFRASARFLFAVLVGGGAVLAWQSDGDQAKDMIRVWAPSLAELLPASASKQAASPSAAEDQQQLKPIAADQQQLQPIATDLAAVRHTIEQLAANLDQLTRAQEQMAQSIAKPAEQALSQKVSSPPPPKPIHASAPKPVQQPAQLSAQASSKPLRVQPPQSLQPPKQ
jgi:hypothetical protein